jgi:heptosyltransferase-2/heptosyltransferase-3
VLGNYNVTSNTAQFTINKAAASVTPNAANKSYGSADPTLTGTLNGFLAADNVTATYTRATGETVAGGPYIISATLSPAGVAAPRADIDGIAAGCCLEVTAAQRTDLAAWLLSRKLGGQALILMQIGNKRTMRRGPRRLAVNHKYWPQARWAEVLRFLHQRHPQHAIVLLGAGPEWELNEELKALANIPAVHNVADDLPIPRLLALLERAEGLITVDSGPAHAAAAVGCPQVVLFGKASTSLYRPWGTAGADVEVLTGQIDGEPNMLGIDAGSVTAAWARLKLRVA